jgi:hypothetical protein
MRSFAALRMTLFECVRRVLNPMNSLATTMPSLYAHRGVWDEAKFKLAI